MGKILILVGIVLVIAGSILEFAPNVPLGRLPGDIRIEREKFSFYFPITTCVLISLVLMLLGYLWNKIR
ncbi:DUF2905 domain-containing protein [Ekhidna sp.]|uniref:DUF2905 domain-containing protein n=1 Tax=Ekhidna sp. TaxID=2608089 RepID=UPI0032EEB04E